MKDIEQQIQLTGYAKSKLLELYGISTSTFYGWQSIPLPKDESPKRMNPRSLLPEEINNILEFRELHPNEGYRKFTWMLNDAGIAYAPESAVYQVLKKHDKLSGWNTGDGIPTGKEYRHKPKRPHHHWHTDIAYIKINGIFYFLIMMLDGYSRYLLDWELMSDMLGESVEAFVLRVKEKYPHAKPMLIHDNGSQFISNDFKKLMTQLEIQQVRTRRNHPQTNGKIERMNGTVKNEAIRPNAPDSYEEACNVLNEHAYFYNHHRLHAGIDFLRPADMFFGRAKDVLSVRQENIMRAKARRMAINNGENVL